MRLAPFQSGYVDAAVPRLQGAPMTQSVLDSFDASTPLGARIDGSSRELLIEAVRSSYFAKEFHLQCGRVSDRMPADLSPTISRLRVDLMRAGYSRCGGFSTPRSGHDRLM
jgi:hypothetical protein